MPVNIFPLVVFDFGAFGFSILHNPLYNQFMLGPDFPKSKTTSGNMFNYIAISITTNIFFMKQYSLFDNDQMMVNVRSQL